MPYTYLKLLAKDVDKLKSLTKLFGDVFGETDTYHKSIPDDSYLKKFLEQKDNIVIVALDKKENVVGGLVAYTLRKFEQKRSEMFIYDLAVSPDNRRQGIATQLIEQAKSVARTTGNYLVFVQAEKDDTSAVNFYKTLNPDHTEEALHFEINL